jgi:hypothetical protein
LPSKHKALSSNTSTTTKEEKKTFDILDFIKIKHLYSSKDPTRRMKKQAQTYRKH